MNNGNRYTKTTNITPPLLPKKKTKKTSFFHLTLSSDTQVVSLKSFSPFANTVQLHSSVINNTLPNDVSVRKLTGCKISPEFIYFFFLENFFYSLVKLRKQNNCKKTGCQHIFFFF